jgi:hypothetical protein
LGRITLVVAHDLSDRVAGWLLAEESQRRTVQDVQHTVAVYSSAVERMLGAPSGSVELFDGDMLVLWAGRSARHDRHFDETAV